MIDGIIHIANGIGRRSFGVGQVVISLADAQSELGMDVEIWSLDGAQQSIETIDLGGLDLGKVRGFKRFGPRKLGYSPAMISAARSGMCDSKVMHQHGLWTAISYVTGDFRSFSGLPTVITPHGSLDPWALNRSIWKKRLSLLMYERRNLKSASCLHALSLREAEGFRSFGLRNPIAVIPNGISQSWLSQNADGRVFREKYGISANTKIMLFLGRITPKKGLPVLLTAMSRLRSFLTGWRLVIAGVDEFDHQQRVQAMVDEQSLGSFVQFVGPQYDEAKRQCYAAADVFVLPSHSEGAPMTVLEALGAGVPVLTTKASPCEYLETHTCGWWPDTSEDSIAEWLEVTLRTPRSTLKEMGQRGQDYVAQHFTWNKIAQHTMALYGWLLGQGEQPGFVIKD